VQCKIIKKYFILKKTFKKPTKKVAIFASGNGSNALNIIKYFKDNSQVEIVAVFCNNPKAKVIEKAKAKGVEVVLFSKKDLQGVDKVLKKLEAFAIDLIVLAGFLLKIPKAIISCYPDKILNIHPALLPKYGGKGMYGKYVHQAVVENKEAETGITIHYVNENYDEGAIIFQARCKVTSNDTPDDVASKIRKLEMQYFPQVIEKTIKNNNTI
jgi:phosphoribosylglycinamide formyltransferase-1